MYLSTTSLLNCKGNGTCFCLPLTTPILAIHGRWFWSKDDAPKFNFSFSSVVFLLLHIWISYTFLTLFFTQPIAHPQHPTLSLHVCSLLRLKTMILANSEVSQPQYKKPVS